MLRKLPSALDVGVLLMKFLRVALPQSTVWFVGMPLLDTMRFTYIMPHEKRKLSAFAEGFLLFICVTWLVLGTHLLLTFLLGRYIDLHGLM